MASRKLTYKDLTAAIRAPFAKRFGIQSTPLVQDHAETNDFRHLVSSAADSYDLEVSRVDTDNVVRIGQTAISPLPQTVSFAIGANGSIGTTTFFIADRVYYIQSISEVHKTAGTNGSAVTAVITHEKGNTASGSGSTVMTTTFDLKGTANTVQTATLNGQLNLSSDTVLVLQPGDRLSFVPTGTLTTLAGVVVTVVLTPGSKSELARYYVCKNADMATQTFFIANRDMTVKAVYAIWGTAFAAAVTLDVTHETTTGAPGAGNSILAAAMAADGAANTLVTPALTATASRLYLPAGDRLSAKLSATTTGANLCIVVVFQPLYNRTEKTFQVALNAAQQVSQNFWISDGDYSAYDLSVVYGTAAGGAATGNVEVCKGTTAPGSGVLVASAANLNTTTNTVIVGTMSSTRSLQISAGDRLSWQATTGAAQSLANIAVTISLVRRS